MMTPPWQAIRATATAATATAATATAATAATIATTAVMETTAFKLKQAAPFHQREIVSLARRRGSKYQITQANQTASQQSRSPQEGISIPCQYL